MRGNIIITKKVKRDIIDGQLTNIRGKLSLTIDYYELLIQ